MAGMIWNVKMRVFCLRVYPWQGSVKAEGEKSNAGDGKAEKTKQHPQMLCLQQAHSSVFVHTHVSKCAFAHTLIVCRAGLNKTCSFLKCGSPC